MRQKTIMKLPRNLKKTNKNTMLLIKSKGTASGSNIFKGYSMVSIGKRLANIHEASLKIIARSKIWKAELGIGYETAIINSQGECYADLESKNKIDILLKTKDIEYAQLYIKKLSGLRNEILNKINIAPNKNFTDDFACMMAYFFIIQHVFTNIYERSNSGDQKTIEKWRNDATIFEPLDLYYKIHPEQDLKSKRNWSWVFINDNLKFYNKKITFADENKIKAESKKTEFSANHTIKGSPAFPGLIKGVIRLILSPKDKKFLKTGEIIVAPMTTVDFLPIMKKAKGFITDEGGITCHAAIVARELKKPCIIGTKIATQVLKNGDKIELDANNGIIRVLPVFTAKTKK